MYQRSVYDAQAESQQRIIERLKNDRRSLEIAEARLVQDSRRLTAFIQAQTEGAIILPPGNGYLTYPVQGVVTSTFGWRIHPILGYEKFHSGIDFGADYGTPIYAAQGGEVIWRSGTAATATRS
jgi:Membrane proteins related to metalloendopeptidases